MKRGEVVDAETAVKLTQNWSRHRPVIWPDRLFTEATRNCTRVDLSEFPCKRQLAHIRCCPDGIFAYVASPIVGKEYGIIVNHWTADYDGANIKKNVKSFTYVETEKAKKEMRDRFWDLYRGSGRGRKAFDDSLKFIVLESELDIAAQPDRMDLLPLWYAVSLEQFAFSSRTAIKQHPTLKQAMNRSPINREWPPIEIINLRLPEKKENPDSEGRELTIRFYVKGHFRRQWRPSTKDHKLIWIDEHIRGPEDAPLKPKPTKVYKVTR